MRALHGIGPNALQKLRDALSTLGLSVTMSNLAATTAVPSNFSDLWCEDRRRQWAAFQQILDQTSQPVEWARDVWDELLKQLTDKSNRNRSIAAQVFCNLAKSDPSKRMLRDFPALFDVVNDERFVTAAPFSARRFPCHHYGQVNFEPSERSALLCSPSIRQPVCSRRLSQRPLASSLFRQIDTWSVPSSIRGFDRAGCRRCGDPRWLLLPVRANTAPTGREAGRQRRRPRRSSARLTGTPSLWPAGHLCHRGRSECPRSARSGPRVEISDEVR